MKLRKLLPAVAYLALAIAPILLLRNRIAWSTLIPSRPGLLVLALALLATIVYRVSMFVLVTRRVQRLGCINKLGAATATGFTLAVIVSPILEELLFRGALQPTLGLPATACLFAAMHATDSPLMPTNPLLALPMGFGFGAVALYGGLGVAILAHSAFNLSGLVALQAMRRCAAERGAAHQVTFGVPPVAS